MLDNECWNWPRYFHVAPMMLGEGSIIQPGNWGRVLRMNRGYNVSPALFREYVLEQIRAGEFPDKPSRLNCLFLLTSLEEATLYRDTLHQTDLVYEVAINIADTAVHFGDYNFGGQGTSVQLLEGMLELARKYWSVEPTHSIEVLFPGSAIVLKRH